MVIILIVMVSTLLMPNLFKVRDSQNSASFRTGFINMALAAKEYAVRNQTTTILELDENGNLAWRPSEEEVDAQGNSISQDTTEANAQRRTLTKPSDVTFTNFKFYEATVVESEWKCEFYANGTADQASLEFEQNGRSFVFDVEPKLGLSTLTDGTIDDKAPSDWEAGELERRA